MGLTRAARLVLFDLVLILLIGVISFAFGLAVGRASAAPGSAAPVIPAAPHLRDVRESDPGRQSQAPSIDAGTTSEPLLLVTREGLASTYGPGFDGWTASPWPRGTVLEICGRACVTRTTTDVGPDQAIYPDRVVDLDVATFEEVCAVSWRMGLCPVVVTVLSRG
jgi:hypothetical protein